MLHDLKQGGKSPVATLTQSCTIFEYKIRILQRSIGNQSEQLKLDMESTSLWYSIKYLHNIKTVQETRYTPNPVDLPNLCNQKYFERVSRWVTDLENIPPSEVDLNKIDATTILQSTVSMKAQVGDLTDKNRPKVVQVAGTTFEIQGDVIAWLT